MDEKYIEILEVRRIMQEQRFTIGQVEKITGVSKDRLRNYDKKQILFPSKQEENQYRCYCLNDIIEIMGIEYLRTMDIGLSEIKEIKESDNIGKLADVFQKKSKEVSEEIENLLHIQSMLNKAQNECERIERSRNCFSIEAMPAFEIIGTLSETTSFDEYEKLREDQKLNKPILKSIMRKMLFSDEGIYQNDVFVIEEKVDTKEILYPECLYTIIEEKVGESDVSPDIFNKSIEWIIKNGYEVIGEAYIKPLMVYYPGQEVSCFLEIYIPVR